MDDFEKWSIIVDLRTKKTLRALREAFFELRRELSLERITVRALCERAEVGKGTFYLHYHSIYDLSDELQEQVVRQVIDDLAHPEAALSDTRLFTRELFSSFVAHSDLIGPLFLDGQEHALVELVERVVHERIVAAEPVLADDRRFNVLLTFQVHGSSAAYLRYAQAASAEERELVVSAIADASDAVSHIWLGSHE